MKAIISKIDSGYKVEWQDEEKGIIGYSHWPTVHDACLSVIEVFSGVQNLVSP